MGDNSDNIPGVPGVGIKTATRLLKQYQTLEGVYDHLDEISGKKLKENLTTYKQDALMSQELARINRQSPIKISLDDLTYEGYDDNNVYAIFQELEFQSLMDRLGIEYASDQDDLKDIDYVTLEDVTSDIFTGAEAIVVE